MFNYNRVYLGSLINPSIIKNNISNPPGYKYSNLKTDYKSIFVKGLSDEDLLYKFEYYIPGKA